MEEMQNQELCILLDSILALLETNNEDKAKEIIRNAIKRIDKGSTSSSKEEQVQKKRGGAHVENWCQVRMNKRLSVPDTSCLKISFISDLSPSFYQ